MNQGTFSDYHWQDTVSSGYMYIYGGSSPMWMDISDPKQYGIFFCGSNVWRYYSGGKYPYAEYVGSRLSKN